MFTYIVTPFSTPQKICIFLLIAGILGNLAALIKLARYSRRTYFIIFLKCLISNNLISLSGVTITLTLHLSLPESFIKTYIQWFCASWVVFRFFGICSGCLAVFMSYERYIAVCYIYYHRVHWTRYRKKVAIIGLTLLSAFITFLPFFGFGAYIDEKSKKCIYYRDAKTPSDRAYAYLFVAFGTSICIIIVTFNTFVIKALIQNMRRMDQLRNASSLNIVVTPTTGWTLPSTEIKCSKLMVMLDLSFILCWMPQMFAAIFVLWNILEKKHWFYKLAELLIVLHYTLDPYIYVLDRKNLQTFWNIIRCRSLPHHSNSSPAETFNSTG